jgi:hypothetical protein
MNTLEYSVILVHSTSHAVKAEQVLARAGIASKLIPVPRQISSDCGSCIRVERLHVQRAQHEMESAGLEVDGVHDIG